MIITCINCYKNFNIDSNDIPENGRLLQCGACGKKWFFKTKMTLPIKGKDIIDNNVNLDMEAWEKSKVNEEQEFKKSLQQEQDNQYFFDDDKNQKNEPVKNVKKKKLNKILNYILVSIISFIALIILLDTFKKQLSVIIPNIETILYNLYESIKDIILFFKDLT